MHADIPYQNKNILVVSLREGSSHFSGKWNEFSQNLNKFNKKKTNFFS